MTASLRRRTGFKEAMAFPHAFRDEAEQRAVEAQAHGSAHAPRGRRD